ncbi:MAG: COX15/CtaA family protein [Pirellulales bacterium]|nr:COX15/CtaA family protein [Pirellulales bacterium]
MNTLHEQPISRWPHRLAVALVCAVFPLIWVGGLVTTYEAGMAVPDWPSTYGYNLFLYPWQTWLLGPWDLFIEHGHRLLGALAGLLTMAVVVAVWMRDRRTWVRWLAVLALVAVLAQGALGGMRVLMDERLLAKIHGCFGPAYFALCVALAAVTSVRWQTAPRAIVAGRIDRFRLAALLTAVLAYFQLVLGAQLRHLTLGVTAQTFQVLVLFHLLMACVLTFYILRLAALAWPLRRSAPFVARPALCLAPLLLVQLLLGAGAWITNYGWPVWFADRGWAAGYTVTAEGPWQAMITTGHVAVGSLILVTAVLTVLRTWRFLGGPAANDRSASPLTKESMPLVLLGAAWGMAR